MNVIAMAREAFDGLYRQRVFRAVVTGVSGELVEIQRTGQAAPDSQAYPRLASYVTPSVGDEVIVQQVGDGWLITGKVLR